MEIKKNENVRYPYLDLLSDNSPQVFVDDYYEDAAILDKQIKTPNVNNIAIVAKYGAGKSSVINTYLSLYRNKKTLRSKIFERFLKKKRQDVKTERASKEKKGDIKEESSEKKEKDGKTFSSAPEKNKYTRISLSTFNNNEYNETAIERSILQQLLYSRKKEKLPNSKIERTNKTSRIKSAFFALLFTCFLVCTVLMSIEFSLFGRDIQSGGATSLFNAEWVKFVLLGISGILLFCIVIWLIHYKKLRKIKYKDLEADIALGYDGSQQQVTNLINKFIDEVLYFFECVDIDLVIFEDLDRLPTTEIFVKLRELNTIINGSAKKAKKVTFIYAVKDDLFKTEEERAKFFEFILPVVPVINPVTTQSKIEERLTELTAVNANMQLTGKFIKGISIFIPDMRILKNSFNDYIMMYHKIFEDKNAGKNLKADNLFALCLYKNLFPYDYALLEKNLGLIPLVVDMDRLHEICLAEINEEINRCNNRLEELKEEGLNSFEELKAILIYQLYKCSKSNYYSGSIDPLTLSTFNGLDFSKLQYPNSGYRVELKDVKELLTPKGERFIDVEDRIKEKTDNGIELLKNKITELEEQKLEILSWDFKKLVENISLNTCFENVAEAYEKELGLDLTNEDNAFIKFLSSKFVNIIDENTISQIETAYKDFAHSKLPQEQLNLQISYLRFLVAQSYIDEHYIEYTSNYKAEILSPNDIRVVQEIQSGQQNFNANIEDIDNVLRWLDEENFKTPAVLCKAILHNICKLKRLSRNENDQKFNNFMNMLADKKNSIVFKSLQDFFKLADDNIADEVLKELTNKRKIFCKEIISSGELTVEKQDFILVEFIKYSLNFDDENIGKDVKNYIANHSNYLKLLANVGDIEKVKKFIQIMNPKFKKIQRAEEGHNELIDFIINNCCYEVNLDNLEYVFNVNSDLPDNEFYTKNYEFILASGNVKAIEYISKNIDNYVRNILLNDKITCAYESEENILSLLQNESVNIANKKSLIRKANVKFNNVSAIMPELFEDIFAFDKAEATWFNVQFAYEKCGFECVKEFINRDNFVSDDFVAIAGIDQATPLKLIISILEEFNTEEIKNVYKYMNFIVDLAAVKSDKIHENALEALIGSNKSKFNLSDINLLWDKPKLLCAYIVSHNEDIIKNFDSFFSKTPSQNCLAEIIGDNAIDISIKQKIINKFIAVIDISGFENVYAEYILSGQAVPNRILWQFGNTDLSSGKKIEILSVCNFGNSKDLTKLKEYLCATLATFNDLFSIGGKISIEKTAVNKNLLDVLQKEKIIGGYKKAPKKEEYIVSAV